SHRPGWGPRPPRPRRRRPARAAPRSRCGRARPPRRPRRARRPVPAPSPAIRRAPARPPRRGPRCHRRRRRPPCPRACPLACRLAAHQARAVSTIEVGLTAAGIFAFALSGALMAVRKRMDVIGMFVLGAATAVGGGVTRDLLLGLSPAALHSPWWWLLGAAATVLACVHGAVGRLRRGALLSVAAGRGGFRATPGTLARAAGIGRLGSVLTGTVGGVAGAALRDVLAGESTAVLRSDTQLYV